MIRAWGWGVLFVFLASLFIAIFLGLFVSPLPWVDTHPDPWPALIRIGLFLIAFCILRGYISYWSREHSKTFETQLSNPIELSTEMPEISGAAAVDDFEKAYADLAPAYDLSHAHILDSLTLQLVSPRVIRRRIHERVAILPNALSYDVTVHIPTTALRKSGDKLCLIVADRPGKSSQNEDFSIRDQSGDGLELLNYRFVNALLYGAIRNQIRVCTNTITVASDILTDVADLIISPEPDPKVAGGTTAQETELSRIIYTKVTSEASPESTASKENTLLWGLLSVAAVRRPVIVSVPEPSGRELVLTMHYLQRLQAEANGIELHVDGWRNFVHKVRAWAGLPPSQIILDAASARSALSYRMTVTVPEGTYINDSLAYAAGQKTWIPNTLNRNGYYKAFVGWTEPNGSSQSSLGCRFLTRTDITGLQFYVRICERPPGTAGSALLVALAVTLIVWLAGFVTTTTADPKNVDIVALALAFPTVFALWFNIKVPDSLGPYRSMWARISLVLSGILSLVAIGLYMVKSKPQTTWEDWLGERSWWENFSFAFIDDPMWAGLLALAILNSLAIAVPFYLWGVRFMGQRNLPGHGGRSLFDWLTRRT